jgi:hypothetical protein
METVTHGRLTCEQDAPHPEKATSARSSRRIAIRRTSRMNRAGQLIEIFLSDVTARKYRHLVYMTPRRDLMPGSIERLIQSA